MATDAQVAANRANAKRSTGPKSETGKANSSKNALKHGGYTKHHVILPGEDESQYEALLESIQAEFQPRTPAERHLVREMAESQWRLARFGRYEQEALAEAGPNPDVNLLLKYDRLTNSANRTWHKCLQTLAFLRKVRQRYPMYLVPDPRIEETNPIPSPDIPYPDPMPPAPESPPGPVQSGEPLKIPYALGMELKKLKRFHPHFDPRRSRSNISPELKAFLKDRNNLELVLNAMVFL
jgi:hypothetical protein